MASRDPEQEHDPERRAEWRARARSFGRVAEAYDRHRPGYPDRLYADVLALAPGSRVLEAGAGTGRATLELARRGAHVVAVEPDPEMAAVARHRLAGLDVAVEESRFEDHGVPAASVDLVVAAQAWHWVDLAEGPRAAARALVDDGVLAVWWNRPRDPSGPVWDAVHEAYARHEPGLTHSSRVHSHTHSRAEDSDAPEGFTAWERRTYEWSAPYDADAYTALLGTYSDHIRLPDDRRERLLAAVHDAITAAGGVLEYRYRTLLLTARPDRRRPAA